MVELRFHYSQRNSQYRPSPRPSPPSTGEREQEQERRFAPAGLLLSGVEEAGTARLRSHENKRPANGVAGRWTIAKPQGFCPHEEECRQWCPIVVESGFWHYEWST